MNRILLAVVGAVALLLLTAPGPGVAAERDDASLYRAGIAAFERQDYSSAVDKMLLLLQKHPDTPLRDVATFCLARASYRMGNIDQAARYISSFRREYPDSPLMDSAEKELLRLAQSHERDKQLPLPPNGLNGELKERVAAEKEATQESHKAALQRAAEQQNPVNTEADRVAAENAAAAKILRVREALKKKSEEKRQPPQGEEGQKPPI